MHYFKEMYSLSLLIPVGSSQLNAVELDDAKTENK
jgi:hypothetical protein